MTTKFICDQDSLTDRHGTFIIEALVKGAGAIIGNALRRVLVSQLEGVAITAIKIQGVLHEFAAIPGAVEDTSDVIRNLRSLELKLIGLDSLILHVSADGKGTIKAKDLIDSDKVTILNHDAHVITLESGAKFNAEIRIENGVGFKMAEECNDNIGFINIDANFSPIQKAGYSVKEMENGFESLSLEILTNGTIGPIDALKKAVAILITELREIRFTSSKFDGNNGTFVADVKSGGHTMGSMLCWFMMSGDENVTYADYTIQPDNGLMLEVYTNGSISPKDAVTKACSRLIGMMDIFSTTPSRERGKGTRGKEQGIRNGVISFGDPSAFWQAPDLLDVQLISYEKFMQKNTPPDDRKIQGFEKVLRDTFPIKANGMSLECLGYSCCKASKTPAECLELSLTYAIPVNLRMRLTIEKTGRMIEEEVPVGQIPFMAEDGTFIVNGVRRVVIGQLIGGNPNGFNDLSVKSVKTVGDFLCEEASEAFNRLKLIATEKMAVIGDQEFSPISLLCTKDSSGNPFIEPVATALNRFFVRHPYSQVVQECNTLDKLTHCRRVRQEVEGATEYVPAEPRALHHTAYGRICHLETPEGPSVGLIGTLAMHASINDEGFITAPYRKVIEGKAIPKISHLTAQEEQDLVISTTDFKGENSRIPARIKDDVQLIEPGKVDFVDAFRQQSIGPSASLIPFLEHDDPNRALMGCNMQRQAVPLVFTEQPAVLSGAEGKIAIDSRDVVISRNDGIVKSVTSERIEIANKDGNTDTYHLMKYRPAGGMRTCINQKPVLKTGQEVTKGQVIADGPSSKDGLLALGRNIMVAYMPWDGYNFEDAILVSEKLIREDIFTSLHIQSYQAEIRDTRYGIEEFTKQPPLVSESTISHLDDAGIAKIGSYVKAGDILAGKMTPKAMESSPEERLLSAIYGHDKVSYDDASLRMPPGTEGRVTKIIRLSRAKGDSVPKGVHEVVKVEVTTKRRLKVGDKLAGRHGNKGTISKILPDEDMPFLPDGTPVEMLLSPLGVPSRMNMGQIFETHLGWAAKTLGANIISPPFHGPDHSQIKDLFAKACLPANGMTIIHDGRNGRAVDTEVTVGYQYLMKLIHIVDDKIHARSIGPYSLFTQQPTGGRSQFGGQRLGEMEVNALEAYGAAYTLREMLTIKSDDVSGRIKTYESLLKGSDSALIPTMPETLKKLILCLRGIGFDMNPVIHDTAKDCNFESLSVDDIAAMTIALASPEKIISQWSRGVVEVESATWENSHPTQGSLFCEKIFGPVRDWECQCGNLSGKQYKGEICTECGVAVGPASMRNESMGHIELAVPVCHSWLLAARPNPVAELLDMEPDDVKKVVYYEKYIATDPRDTRKTSTGSAAIKELLSRIDLDSIIESSDDPDKKRLAESLKNSGIRPEWMILECLPVLPPGMRPVRHLEGGEVASLDLNELYTRVISRNNKYKELAEIDANSQECLAAGRMIQESVDSLLGNGRRSEGESGRLKSLSDLLKGKEGMFRGNLLGKRVDYSGRSVIVVGPELKLDECGLPESMAIELFRPFIMNKLIASGAANSFKNAREMVDRCAPEAKKAVREVAKERLVMLNRAPTLHRVGIQAFKPVITDLSAIKLHPLVCVGFNADFDGDQMAVFIPLSAEAQEEARQLMLSPKNVFSSAHGGVIAQPAQEIIAGIYYMTMENSSDPIFQFGNILEVKKAYELGRVGLHDSIRFQINQQYINTTVGKALFNEIVPVGLGKFINQQIDQSILFLLIQECRARLGEDETTRFLNALNDMGFKYATRLGVSIGIDILKPLPDKDRIMAKMQAMDDDIKRRLVNSEIDYETAMNQRIEAWTDVSEELTSQAMKSLEQDNQSQMNAVLLMLKSGARGRPHHLKNLIGSGGAIITTTGALFRMPINSNYMAGLSSLEHFMMTIGARYGLIATATVSSMAGYMMRKTISACQDVIITQEDCETKNGIIMKALNGNLSISHRIYGRVTAEDIKHPETGNVIASAGQIIDDKIAQEIGDSGIQKVKVRSPLTCEADHGTCAKCYGFDLATGDMVKLGEPVGIIAGTAIGEPATQLTFRLFHLKFGKSDYALTGLPMLEAILEARETARVMVDGSPISLNEALSQKGEDEFQVIILNELMKLYNEYGIGINDKHFEVLLSQMLSQVRIADPGDTRFYAGEVISRAKLRAENRKIKGKKASVKPIFNGLYKTALATDSFLAAAAFGDTVNVLAQAAVRYSKDELRGMRESLIVGKLIPAGTGFRKENL